MKVLMLKDVGGVGRHGEIKDVSDGFALNLLIPRGQAVQATAERVAAHAKESAAHQAAVQKEEAAIAASVEALRGARVEMKVRATEKGGLFKAIGKGEVKKAIHEQKGASVPEAYIKLDKPIKTTGDHPVTIAAGKSAADITLAIVAA